MGHNNFIFNYLLAVIFIFTTGCEEGPSSVKKAETKWYKGNTHAHTTLCGHADTHPDTVALWYLERDYNFLILSEHDQFIDPANVNLPEGRRKDFILIPGEELSHYNHVHATAMNIDGAVHTHPHADHSVSNVELVQAYVDSTREMGGELILNHPNFGHGISAAEIGQVERLPMFELYNGHPAVYNWGTETLPSVEQKWDSLLTAGKRILGVSSDDAHQFKTWGKEISNPGRGWVMVQSEELSADAITDAMLHGDFYASSGVQLKRVHKDQKRYEIEIDPEATFRAVADTLVIGLTVNDNVKDGFTIEFIGDGGEMIQSFAGTSASFDLPEGLTYVRGKVSYTAKRATGFEQFFAWTQPVFLE